MRGSESLPFVDWVNLYQTHPDGVEMPVIGSQRLLKTDMECEKLTSDAISVLRHGGSHSTAVFVRSDGHYAHLWGNVGRLGRPDNVFNLNWSDTFAKAGEVVSSYGLPAFTVGNHYFRSVKTPRDVRLGLFNAYTGCKLSELHLTKNYSAGSDGLAHEAMKYFLTQRASRLSKSRLGATTVVFGSHAKGGRQVEVYLKADEMLAHAKGEKAKLLITQSPLYQWARDVGLVRVECKFRRMALRDVGMNYAGGVTMEKIVRLFDKNTQFLRDAQPERIVRLADQLPRKLRLVALSWLRGDDLRSTLSRATFYRFAKELRGFGMDISEPRGVSDHAEKDLQKLLDGLPRFELHPLAEPEFYSSFDEWKMAA